LAKKLRVYEIAKELNLSNKEALDLCLALGIDVKSHSSSVEEAHVDRVRRRAQREGIGIYGEQQAPKREEAPAATAPAPPAAPEPEPEVKASDEGKPDLATVIAKESQRREEQEEAAIANAARSAREGVEGRPAGRPRPDAPLSFSGKPIPPPPGRAPMRSFSGKPIPPPPRPIGPRG
jgi:translation initiation factor IF-2